MKPGSLLFSATALATAVAASSSSYGAYLWTVDTGSTRQTSGTQVQSITNEAAEGILLRRKGQPDSLFQHDINEDILSDIDAYGGYQKPLFGSGNEQYPERLLVKLSGYTGGVTAFAILPELWVEEPTRALLDTFQSKINQDSVCEYHINPRTRPDVSIVYTYSKEDDSPCRPQQDVEISPTVLVALSTIPTGDTIAAKIGSFYRNMLHLRATADIESTLLILPPTKQLTAAKKPTKHTELRKRAEVPLEAVPTAHDAITYASNKTSSNHTLPRDIPECFGSMSACQNTTNSCMGHGKCVKKSDSCYKCSCSRTVVRKGKEGESDKTILWGGNACQKKDVSAEFNLFAGVTIALFTLAAAGVGMLFRMGSQDLPSVIGAGVVGPRAQQ